MMVVVMRRVQVVRMRWWIVVARCLQLCTVAVATRVLVLVIAGFGRATHACVVAWHYCRVTVGLC